MNPKLLALCSGGILFVQEVMKRLIELGRMLWDRPTLLAACSGWVLFHLVFGGIDCAEMAGTACAEMAGKASNTLCILLPHPIKDAAYWAAVLLCVGLRRAGHLE
jgi:hypothetical protein